MYRYLVLSCMCFFASALVGAEPPKIVTWLQGNPMTQFDWGIYKADKRLATLERLEILTGDFLYGETYYDLKANKLRLRVHILGKGTEAECRDNLRTAKSAFLEFKTEDKDQQVVATKLFRELFRHESGLIPPGEPANMGEEIAEIATIEAILYTKGPDGVNYAKLICESNFRSQSVRVHRP